MTRFEDLDIQNLLKNHHLGKSISDVAWGMLVKATESKAENAGSKVVLVDPKYTSQMYSRCGIIVKKDLSERIHGCSECGLTIDRDINAAINILRLGMQSVRKSDRSPVLYGGERSQINRDETEIRIINKWAF
jgi:putative transposase